MGGLHSPGKGISASTVLYRRTKPHWLQLSAEETVALIVDLAKKGVRPSQIGAVLHDRNGVGRARSVT
jgi:small subunit ribosomal protein S13e